jgi:hypothetical protein
MLRARDQDRDCPARASGELKTIPRSASNAIWKAMFG